MADGNKFVSRLAHIKCSCGTKINYLNAPMDHGIILTSGEPLLNANDHEPGAKKNIVHFGRCKSMNNPGNVIAKGVAGGLVPGIGAFLGEMCIEDFGCCKCNPKTFTPWEAEDSVDEEMHIIEGAPALTTSHQLTCFYGGVIEITDDEIK